MSLATCQMVAAFSRRCRCSRIPADQPRLLVVTLLRLGLTSAAWERILGELIASGLLLATFASLAELRDAIDALTISTPANLILSPGDCSWASPSPHLLLRWAVADALWQLRFRLLRA